MATPTIPSTCAAVTSALLTESGRLGGTMFDRSARKRPIIRLQSKTRGAFENGMGFSYKVSTFERSFAPLTGDPWTTIAASDGDTANACRPPTDTVGFGQTSRDVIPRHYALNTEDFCIRDIQFGWQFRNWMQMVSKALSTIPEWVWARRFTQDYVNMAGHNAVLNATSGIVDGTTFGSQDYDTSSLPTGKLTQEVLDYIYMDLFREGGESPSGISESDQGPVFTLITSSETAKGIIFGSPGIRDDVRYAYMGKGEMTPLVPGMPTRRREYGGYVHEIDPYPRRFIFNGSAYVEVAPFIASSTTKGNKWEQNPSYQAAPYEESIIWHEGVYRDLAVNTTESTPPGWAFTPRTWLGSFSVRNILERTCNPDGTMIFFRALFASAAEPIDPAVGWTILHARCGALDVRSCYES